MSMIKGPRGFLFSGVPAGVRVKRPDLALLFTEVDATVVGSFTRSRTRAASVDWSASRVPGTKARAVVINSGNANALTGPEGILANQSMAAGIAEAIGVDIDSVLTCSTGLIGIPLPLEKIKAAIPSLMSHLGEDILPFAEAIQTTDTTLKVLSRELFVGGDRVTVLGVAKGSGMVHPNMGTVLAFLLTDAAVSPEVLDTLLKQAIEESFHMLSVDGDSSTNDTVLALASGMAENKVIQGVDEAGATALGVALTEISCDLARAIAADGEGARRLISVDVLGAGEVAHARKLARAVVASNLVKAAIFGSEPNWGRVMAALGAEAARSDIPLDLKEISLKIQEILVFSCGAPYPFEADRLRALLRRGDTKIEIFLGDRDTKVTAWGCDLSYDYVRINADYAAVVIENQSGLARRDTRLEMKTPDMKAEVLIQALRYIERFAGTRAVVKFGGSAAIRPELRERLASDLRLLQAVGLRLLLVHGGGLEISKALDQLGEKRTFIDGLQVTEESHVKIAEMVLSGQISGEIIAALSRAGARAVGLSGKDGNLIAARKLFSPSGADLGYVGEVTKVDPTILELLLAQGYLPLLSPLGMGEDGHTYNISADSVAAEVAVACKAKKLIFLADSPGILTTDGALISELSAEELDLRVRGGALHDAVLPRAHAALRALADGVESVHIIDGRIPHNVVAELFTSSGVGTMIRADAPRNEDEVARG